MFHATAGNAGGIMSSFIYTAKDKPKYTKGHAICVAYCGIVFFSALFMTTFLKRKNQQKADRNAARAAPWTREEMEVHQDEGDKVDWFVYTI